MAGYNPKGARKNPPTIVHGVVLGRNGRPLTQCGTPGGWWRHMRQNENACDECREAHRLHRNPDAKRRNAHPGADIPHGTDRGYQLHLARNTIPCRPCCDAHAARHRADAARRRQQNRTTK